MGDAGPAELTARRLRDQMAGGELSPVEVARCFLDRIRRLDGELHAFVTVDERAVLAQAEALERRPADAPRGPLYGLPVAVKDQFATRGLRTTSGSAVYRDHVPDTDAVCVARVRAADGIVLGKTNTPEFGLHWRTLNRVAPESRNPWRPDTSPGGSSGGSAVAVAAGMAPLAVGSDCAGSIRLPAAFCGVTGLLPGLGQVPRTGGTGVSRWFTGVGPIARDSADAALLFDALAGPSDTDPVTELVPGHDPPGDGDGPRWQCWRPDGAPVLEPEVAAVVGTAVDRLAASGARFADTDVVLPATEWTGAFNTITMADRYALQGAALLADPAAEELLTPLVRQRFRTGERVTGAEYALACQTRTAARARLAAALRPADILVSPTVGFPAVPPPTDDWTWRPAGITDHTFVANLTGLPAVTVPCGLVDGLPVALQLMGRRGGEAMLLAVAGFVEDVLGPAPRPGMWA